MFLRRFGRSIHDLYVYQNGNKKTLRKQNAISSCAVIDQLRMSVNFIQLIVPASTVLSLTTSGAVNMIHTTAFIPNKLAIVVMNDVADCDIFRHSMRKKESYHLGIGRRNGSQLCKHGKNFDRIIKTHFYDLFTRSNDFMRLLLNYT